MRKTFPLAMAAFLLAADAFAADAPLPAGKPAGVKQARDWDSTTLELVGLGALGVGIAFLIGGSGEKAGTTPSGAAGTTSPITTAT
jgi:hypothetical protein